MARGGINKALVLKARQALLARGEHPSIDAVRIELGNTGSKTTIHRYLKELEESEAGRVAGAASLSEELTALVARLSERLQAEAQETIEGMRQRFLNERSQLEALLTQAQQRIEQLQAQESSLTTQLQRETDRHRLTRQQLQQAELEQARLQQANQDQATRLEDRDQQIRSLEEKHQHSREALEHYRQASKEQREQEQRRHEAQVQQLQAEMRQLQQSLILKQDEVTQLNRANERLATEVGHMAREQGEQRDRLAGQASELKTLRTQLAQSHTARDVLLERYSLLQAEMAELKAALAEERQQTRSLQVDLSAATTELNLLRQATREQAQAREASAGTKPEGQGGPEISANPPAPR